ncbi:MAG: transporter [Bacteroidota bacterium]
MGTRLATTLTILTALGFAIPTYAQGPIAGFAVPKGEVAIALNYATEHYDTYLNPDGDEDRSLTAMSYSLFVEAGLGDQTAIVVSLPYVETNDENSDFQDASIFLKYRNLESRDGEARHWLHTAVGATFPIGNYPTDGEFAIGQQAFVFQGRLVYQYQHDQGWFLSALSGIDFQLSPDSRAVWPLLFRAGYGAPWLYLEGWLEFVTALDGTQGAETALAGTGSSWTRTGATVYAPITPKFGVQVNGAWILGGEFIGRSTRLGGGVVFKF